MTLEKAKKILDANYKNALALAYVRSPVAWALYQTWQEVDAQDKKVEIKNGKTEN